MRRLPPSLPLSAPCGDTAATVMRSGMPSERRVSACRADLLSVCSERGRWLWWQMAGRRGAFLFSFLPSFPRLRLLAAGGPPREDCSTFGRNVERRRRAARLLMARWGCSSGCSRLQRRRAASFLLHSPTTTPPRLRAGSRCLRRESALPAKRSWSWHHGIPVEGCCGLCAVLPGWRAAAVPPIPTTPFVPALIREKKPLPFRLDLLRPCWARPGRSDGPGEGIPGFLASWSTLPAGPRARGRPDGRAISCSPKGAFPNTQTKIVQTNRNLERRPAPLLLLLLFEG